MLRKLFPLVILLMVFGFVFKEPIVDTITHKFSDIAIKHAKKKGFIRSGQIKNRQFFFLDANGIPIIVKATSVINKTQANIFYYPTDVALRAMTYADGMSSDYEVNRKRFLACCDWLKENLSCQHDYGFYEYKDTLKFLHMRINPPWRSGMAQGLALPALYKAFDMTKDEDYLSISRKIVNSFEVEVDSGGTTLKSEDGWWYEEVAKEGIEETRVLNGMMYALIGLHDFYTSTNDKKAIFLFEKGIQALEKTIHLYDNKGHSYYSLMKDHPGRYHKIHVEQLEQLYSITGIEEFKKYHDLWEKTIVKEKKKK